MALTESHAVAPSLNSLTLPWQGPDGIASNCPVKIKGMVNSNRCRAGIVLWLLFGDVLIQDDVEKLGVKLKCFPRSSSDDELGIRIGEIPARQRSRNLF